MILPMYATFYEKVVALVYRIFLPSIIEIYVWELFHKYCESRFPTL